MTYRSSDDAVRRLIIGFIILVLIIVVGAPLAWMTGALDPLHLTCGERTYQCDAVQFVERAGAYSCQRHAQVTVIRVPETGCTVASQW